MNIDKPLENHISKLKKLWKKSFGDTDESINTFFETAFSKERCMCCFVKDDIVASLYWFNCMFYNKRIAYIYAVSTAKEYRRQGICHKLMEHTHLHLLSNGYAGAVLVPENKELFGFYEQMEYTICTNIGDIHCGASADSIDIRKIDADEYTRIRKSFLPLGGIVQEDENIAYLSAQAQFYVGENFLLAARVDGNTLRGIELLGDTSYAPQITRALECKSGDFRVAGDDRLFSMYKTFDSENDDLPTYFGLAFD
ncbi:MAG: GNAT family N-acetyltransferase [Clostridia bacterium]|nr:GNAT family N-acetyltransferase [Clostridia bacterium]